MITTIESSFSVPYSRESNKSTCPSFFQGRKWDWIKRAALTVALAALAVGIVLVAGITSAVTVCLVGAAAAISAFFCSLMLFKKTAESGPAIPLPLEQGAPYDPADHVNLIKTAIQRGMPLTWKGKPQSDDDFWILPNIRLGSFSTVDSNQSSIQYKPFVGPRIPAEPTDRHFIGNSLNVPITQYFVLMDTGINDKQKEGLIKYTRHALMQGKQVLFTGDMLPVNTALCDELVCPTRQNGLVTDIEASLLVAIYLKHLTQLDDQTVLSYMEKLLDCKYSDKIRVQKIHNTFSYEHHISQWL